MAWSFPQTLRGRLRHRVGACALLALMLQALAPGVSFARAAANGTPVVYAEICTSQGLQRLVPGDVGAMPAGDAAMKDDPCPSCVAHAGCFGLLATYPPDTGPVSDRGLAPAPPCPAPGAQFARAAHQPRGPPTTAC